MNGLSVTIPITETQLSVLQSVQRIVGAEHSIEAICSRLLMLGADALILSPTQKTTTKKDTSHE